MAIPSQIQPFDAPAAELTGVAVERRVWGMSGLSWLMLVAMLGLCAALYGCTLRFPFHFDGQAYVTQNPLIRDLSAFGSYFDCSAIYQTVHDHEMPADLATNFLLRPVTYLTFWANYAVGGLDPAGYRLVNILIHGANAFLIFQLLRLLMRRSCRALKAPPSSTIFVPMTTALIFLVHPMQVESVTYIAQRFTSLATFFYLMAVWLHFRACELQGTRKAMVWRAASVVMLLLGMLSKEIVFTAPIAMVMLDRLVWGTAWRKAMRRALPQLLCLPLLPCLLLNVTQTLSAGHASALDAIRIACPECSGEPHLWYVLTEVRVVAVYVGLLLIPNRLNVDWDYSWSRSVGDWRIYAAALILGAMVAGAWWVGRRREGDVRHRLVFAFVLWYFLTIAVSSSLAPLPDALAEHRAYLSSFGILVALVSLLDLLRVRLELTGVLTWAVPTGAALWIVVMCGATALRNEAWQSNITLWLDSISKSPGNARGWENLGVACLQEGKAQQAESCLIKAMQLKPADPEIYKNLAATQVLLKKYEEAIHTCQIGLHFRGDQAALRYNMALAYWATKHLQEAMAELREALTLSPRHFLSHLCLAGFYAEQRNRAAAMEHYQMAASLYPEDHRLRDILTRIESIRKTSGT